MPKTLFTLASATTLIAALAAVATPAAAASDTDGRPSKGVSFADLDLSTAAGQRQLQARIDRTAREICGADRATTGSRIASREAMACYRQALSRTRERVAQAVARSARGG